MFKTFPRRKKYVAQEQHSPHRLRSARSSFLTKAQSLPFASMILFTIFLFSFAEKATTEACVNSPSNNGRPASHIKEVIPDRFQRKYERWKAEYLSTKAGQEQWGKYEHNSNFALTITVSEERGKGAGTDQYRWNENGQLISATITLGDQADEGFPSPFNYPVTSSLAHTEPFPPISGSILAATKLAHEFGHVIQVGASDSRLFQLQNKLIPIYNRILLSNGRNTLDPKLVELSKQMKGTPVEIGQDRELWAESYALTFLRERCPEDGEYKPVFKAIKSAVESYAKEHMDRFR